MTDVNSHERFGEFPKLFTNGMQRTIFAIFQNDVKIIRCFDEASILDNVWV